MPTARLLVEKVAVKGAVADTVPLPITAVPSRKLTAPVGVPAPGLTAEMVAVNVTPCPKTDGLTDEVRVTVEPALLTTWLTAPLVLVLKLVSPT